MSRPGRLRERGAAKLPIGSHPALARLSGINGRRAGIGAIDKPRLRRTFDPEELSGIGAMEALGDVRSAEPR
jgi:hypothetical protein